MKHLLILLSVFLGIFTLSAQHALLKLDFVYATPEAGKITIDFTLANGAVDTARVFAQVIDKSHPGYAIDFGTWSGDLGAQSFDGSIKSVTWNYPDGSSPENYILRLMVQNDRPVSVEDIVADLDSNLMWQNLLFIEGVRNQQTNPQHKTEVNQWLKSHLNTPKLFARNQAFNTGGTGLENVIGRRQGFSSDSLIYVLDAHYDTVADSPGADDNGSGTAALVEITRVLNRYSFKNTLYACAFDGEEYGLLGSNAFLKSGTQAGDRIQSALNFEMIGYYSDEPNSQEIPNGFEVLFPAQTTQIIQNQKRGDFITNVSNTNSQVISSLFAEQALNYSTAPVITLPVPGKGEITPDLRRSDHASFWDKNIPALMITDGANFRNKNYHTPHDTSGSLSINFMTNIARVSLAVMATQLEPINADDIYLLVENIISNKKTIEDFIELEVYPQPAGAEIKLKFNSIINKPLNIRLFDAQGKIVYQRDGMKISQGDVINIPTQHIPAGIYILKINDDTHEMSRKVIRE